MPLTVDLHPATVAFLERLSGDPPSAARRILERYAVRSASVEVPAPEEAVPVGAERPRLVRISQVNTYD